MSTRVQCRPRRSWLDRDLITDRPRHFALSSDLLVARAFPRHFARRASRNPLPPFPSPPRAPSSMSPPLADDLAALRRALADADAASSSGDPPRARRRRGSWRARRWRARRRRRRLPTAPQPSARPVRGGHVRRGRGLEPVPASALGYGHRARVQADPPQSRRRRRRRRRRSVAAEMLARCASAACSCTTSTSSSSRT